MNIYSTLIVRMQIAEANAKKVLECFSPNKMHHWLFMKRARVVNVILIRASPVMMDIMIFFFKRSSDNIDIFSFLFFFSRNKTNARRLDYVTRLRHPRVASPIRSN